MGRAEVVPELVARDEGRRGHADARIGENLGYAVAAAVA
jgi:hypothetical protein